MGSFQGDLVLGGSRAVLKDEETIIARREDALVVILYRSAVVPIINKTLTFASTSDGRLMNLALYRSETLKRELKRDYI